MSRPVGCLIWLALIVLVGVVLTTVGPLTTNLAAEHLVPSMAKLTQAMSTASKAAQTTISSSVSNRKNTAPATSGMVGNDPKYCPDGGLRGEVYPGPWKDGRPAIIKRDAITCQYILIRYTDQVTAPTPAPAASPAPNLGSCLTMADLAKIGEIITELSHEGKRAGAQLKLRTNWTAPAGWTIHRQDTTVSSANEGDIVSAWSPDRCRPLS